MGYGVFYSFILFQKPAPVRLSGDSLSVGWVHLLYTKCKPDIVPDR